MSSEHYMGCVDTACDGCLPTDEEVAAMSIGQATLEAGRRGLPHVRAGERRQAILDDADSYRARSAATRVE